MPRASASGSDIIALPHVKVCVPSTIDPSENVTVPEASPYEDVTLAVSCRNSPAVAGLVEEARVVVVDEAGPERWVRLNTVPTPLLPPPSVVPYRFPDESMTKPPKGEYPSLQPLPKLYTTFSV